MHLSRCSSLQRHLQRRSPPRFIKYDATGALPEFLPDDSNGHKGSRKLVGSLVFAGHSRD